MNYVYQRIESYNLVMILFLKEQFYTFINNNKCRVFLIYYIFTEHFY